jgi:hypothetical protein
VPDGSSTVSLLGCALLGLAALRRKLPVLKGEEVMKALPKKLLPLIFSDLRSRRSSVFGPPKLTL